MVKLGSMDILFNQLWSRDQVSLTGTQCWATMFWELNRYGKLPRYLILCRVFFIILNF